MKLKYTFESMELDDRIIAVPVGDGAQDFRGVVKLNDSAAEIFDLLKQETTEEAVVEALKARYGDDPEIPGFVQKVVKSLSDEGVLE